MGDAGSSGRGGGAHGTRVGTPRRACATSVPRLCVPLSHRSSLSPPPPLRVGYQLPLSSLRSTARSIIGDGWETLIPFPLWWQGRDRHQGGRHVPLAASSAAAKTARLESFATHVLVGGRGSSVVTMRVGCPGSLSECPGWCRGHRRTPLQNGSPSRLPCPSSMHSTSFSSAQSSLFSRRRGGPHPPTMVRTPMPVTVGTLAR